MPYMLAMRIGLVGNTGLGPQLPAHPVLVCFTGDFSGHV